VVASHYDYGCAVVGLSLIVKIAIMLPLSSGDFDPLTTPSHPPEKSDRCQWFASFVDGGQSTIAGRVDEITNAEVVT